MIIKKPVKNIGDACRWCNAPVELKESPFNEKKLLKPYFFNFYLRCPRCGKVYMCERFKVNSNKYKKSLCKNQQTLL